ncbi:MAG: outer membrane beta-barrel protein [Candidatus Zixiibacteriota bacterium]
MFKVVTVILLMIFPLSVTAQTLPAAEKKEYASQSISNSLRGKHSIAVSAGILGGVTVENEVSAGGEITSVVGNEFLGSIAYTYWLENGLGVNFSIGLLSLDVTNSVQGSEVFTETATVVPLLFGVKYQPFRLTDTDVLRPYVAASVGPFFGTATISRAGVNTETEVYSETALGSRLGVGVDLLLSKWFTLGVGASYYLVSDFEKSIGSEKNYSGPEFSLSFGVVF